MPDIGCEKTKSTPQPLDELLLEPSCSNPSRDPGVMRSEKDCCPNVGKGSDSSGNLINSSSPVSSMPSLLKRRSRATTTAGWFSGIGHHLEQTYLYGTVMHVGDPFLGHEVAVLSL
jgi:hypothetical protein